MPFISTLGFKKARSAPKRVVSPSLISISVPLQRERTYMTETWAKPSPEFISLEEAQKTERIVLRPLELLEVEVPPPQPEVCSLSAYDLGFGWPKVTYVSLEQARKDPTIVRRPIELL